MSGIVLSVVHTLFAAHFTNDKIEGREAYIDCPRFYSQTSLGLDLFSPVLILQSKERQWLKRTTLRFP